MDSCNCYEAVTHKASPATHKCGSAVTFKAKSTAGMPSIAQGKPALPTSKARRIMGSGTEVTFELAKCIAMRDTKDEWRGQDGTVSGAGGIAVPDSAVSGRGRRGGEGFRAEPQQYY